MRPRWRSRRICRESSVGGGDFIEQWRKIGASDTDNVKLGVLQGAHQRPFHRIEEIDPLDGLALHLSGPGDTVQQLHAGRKVIERRKMCEITPVAGKENAGQVSKAVDGLLHGSEACA